MIKLCIGISKITPGWSALFQQIGVEFEEIDFSKNIENSFSTLIINSTLDTNEFKRAQDFASENSAGVLFTKSSGFQASDNLTKVNHPLAFPQSYSEKISLFYLKSGLLTSINFDPDIEFSNSTFKRKRFRFKTSVHPDEIANSVDKKALVQTIESILKQLHIHRKLPFISKWHSPTRKPIFGFRVDSDYGNQNSIRKLYEIATLHSIPMTWFLHVQAHEDWLDVFKEFENQEIALHGYEHGTSTSFEHVINNIEKGKQLLIDAELYPTGFCAPYGIWNETLASVLKEFDFTYSSEFTIGYDTNPFHPIYQDEIHPILQIPIHPICTGSLNRKKVSEKGMKEYFLFILKEKLKHRENVFFYHHPLQPGLKIWNPVFERINELGLTKLTFSEFARFWTSRLQSKIDASFNNETKQLFCSSSNPNLWLKISTEIDSYYLVEASKMSKPLSEFESFSIPPFEHMEQQTIDELIGNRIQLLKTSILDWRNRKRL